VLFCKYKPITKKTIFRGEKNTPCYRFCAFSFFQVAGFIRSSMAEEKELPRLNTFSSPTASHKSLSLEELPTKSTFWYCFSNLDFFPTSSILECVPGFSYSMAIDMFRILAVIFAVDVTLAINCNQSQKGKSHGAREALYALREIRCWV